MTDKPDLQEYMRQRQEMIARWELQADRAINRQLWRTAAVVVMVALAVAVVGVMILKIVGS